MCELLYFTGAEENGEWMKQKTPVHAKLHGVRTQSSGRRSEQRPRKSQQDQGGNG